jgi:hypothetical protein
LDAPGSVQVATVPTAGTDATSAATGGAVSPALGGPGGTSADPSSDGGGP